jgi:hypothetical protein
MASATADPFLIVGFTLLMLVMLIINIYILAYWQHPEDKNESIFPKLLIIFGLQLSAVAVLMLPVGKDHLCNPYFEKYLNNLKPYLL